MQEIVSNILTPRYLNPLHIRIRPHKIGQTVIHHLLKRVKLDHLQLCKASLLGRRLSEHRLRHHGTLGQHIQTSFIEVLAPRQVQHLQASTIGDGLAHLATHLRLVVQSHDQHLESEARGLDDMRHPLEGGVHQPTQVEFDHSSFWGEVGQPLISHFSAVTDVKNCQVLQFR